MDIDMLSFKTGLLAGTLMQAGVRVIVETDDEGQITDQLTIVSPDEDDEFQIRVKVLP